VGARGRHHFSYATAFSSEPLKFREFFSLLKTPSLSASTPDRAPNRPIWGLFEPDLWSLSARRRLCQQAVFFHALVNKGKERKGRGGYEPVAPWPPLKECVSKL
jgi:hypothetical protein